MQYHVATVIVSYVHYLSYCLELRHNYTHSE